MLCVSLEVFFGGGILKGIFSLFRDVYILLFVNCWLVHIDGLAFNCEPNIITMNLVQRGLFQCGQYQ